MFIARMITRSKWEPKPGIITGEIPADAVTGDLRTQGNKLSFWRCPSGANDDVQDVALAIAAGRDSVAKVEIIWIEDEDLKVDGQTLADSDGRTPVKDLVNLHVDVRYLDYNRLGKVAGRIVSALEEDRYLRLTRTRVRNLIASAVANGRISLADLNYKVKNEVQEHLPAEG